jgi:PKD repeat protein
MIKQRSILLFSLVLWTMTSMAQSLQISASTTSGCAPLAVAFSANQTSTSYNWTFSNGSTSTSSNPVVVFTAAGSYSVTLTLANGNSATTQNLVTVSGIPSPLLSVDTNSTCKGNPIQFTAEGAAGSTFYWDMGDGTVLSGINVSHTYAQSGIYSVAIQETSSGGCVGADSFPNAVTILNTPTANITQSIPFACSATNTVTFTSSSSGMSSYQWKINNITIPESGQSFSHVFNTKALTIHSFKRLAEQTQRKQASRTNLLFVLKK